MYLKPAINPDTGQPYVIRQPERRYRRMPDEGDEIRSLSHYYRRHINDGSLIVGSPVANARTLDVEILSEKVRV